MRSLKMRTQRLSRAHPDFAANEFWGRFVKGSFYFHVTIPMYTAPSFLEPGKERLRQWLEVRPLLFKTGSYLLACRAVDALVGNTAFPIIKKVVFLGQGSEAPTLESIFPKVSHSPFHLTFGMDGELHPMQRIQNNIFG